MTILAIDTAAGLCAACVYDEAADIELGRSVHDLGRGHAEHLMAVIGEALEAAGRSYTDLDAVAVSIGPGSFTGIRVGVAAARGLALALSIPAIGVTTLEALAAEAAASFPGRSILAALDGGRGEVHAGLYDAGGGELVAPAAMAADAASALARTHDAVVTGSAAPLFAEDVAGSGATADIATYARLAAGKPRDGERPAPLYLRGADAKVQEGFAVPRKAAL